MADQAAFISINVGLQVKITRYKMINLPDKHPSGVNTRDFLISENMKT